MSLIHVIEDEPILADIIAMAARLALPQNPEMEVFHDAVSAMGAVNEQAPDLILLDVLLAGPDGFAFLNELVSYPETSKIPVIMISSLDFSGQDLSHYGVVQVLNKATMTPQDIAMAVRRALGVPEPEAAITGEVLPAADAPSEG